MVSGQMTINFGVAELLLNEFMYILRGWCEYILQ